VFVDEIETDNPDRARRVFELGRLGATEDQGEVYRGSADGKAMSWPIRASFYFSCILHVGLRAQDLSRIQRLELDQPSPGLRSDGETPQAGLLTRIDSMHAFGPRLMRRMIDGYARLKANLEAYRIAIMALGHPARVADNLGTLLAAAHTLLSDDVIDSDRAYDDACRFTAAEIIGHGDEGDETEALQWLLAWTIPSDQGPSGQRISIGELVRATHGELRSPRNETLRRFGVAVVWIANDLFLAVANKHPEIQKIYADTPYATEWSLALRRVVGARASPDKVSFAGIKSRATIVPWRALDLPEEPKAPPVDGDSM
jgi:hypothetical protein